MKRGWFVLLLLATTLLFCSCGLNLTKHSIGVDENGITLLSEKAIERIERDYFLHEVKQYKRLDVYAPMVQYYGVYGDCVPVMFSHNAPAVMTYEEIDGITLVYGSTIHITVWRNGAFYSLGEAYSQGYLTREQIVAIADVHNGGTYVSTLPKVQVTEKPSDTTDMSLDETLEDTETTE
jgi:hypothetical protein